MQRIAKLTLIILVITAVRPSLYIGAQQHPDLKVHFIDVGQGDSIFVQTPGGKNILIDGGRPKAGKKVVQFLRKKNVRKLDLMIATHPDIDHIGGLAQVMQSMEVNKILETGIMHSTKTYARYVSQIIRQHIPIDIANRNEEIDIDPAINMRILNTHNDSKTNNESSIALKLTYGKIDFLLMSDVEKEQEKRLRKRYDLNSEILKVAHHGSHTSTSLKFLKEVKPNAAILTYGKGNKFGHPVDRVIDNLQKVNTAIYPTASFGNITVRTDGQGFFILNEKDPTSWLEAG